VVGCWTITLLLVLIENANEKIFKIGQLLANKLTFVLLDVFMDHGAYSLHAQYRHLRYILGASRRNPSKYALQPVWRNNVVMFFWLSQNLHTPNVTRSPPVARIANCTGCQWSSRSSKVDDKQVIRKPICDFLLVINSDWPYLSPFPKYGQFPIEFPVLPLYSTPNLKMFPLH